MALGGQFLPEISCVTEKRHIGKMAISHTEIASLGPDRLSIFSLKKKVKFCFIFAANLKKKGKPKALIEQLKIFVQKTR